MLTPDGDLPEPPPDMQAPPADALVEDIHVFARARAAITRPLRRLTAQLRPITITRRRRLRRRRRDQLQAQFSRYSRAYFQRWLFIGALIGVAAGLLMAAFYNAIELATNLFALISGFVPPLP